MKLICLNTWGCRVTDQIFDFINKNSESTDIFCFQEILKGKKGKTEKDEVANAYEKICDLLSNYTGYFWEYNEENYYYDKKKSEIDFQFGVACFVKNNLEQTLKNKIHLYDPKKEWGDYPSQFAVGSSLAIKVEDYTIINIHGLWQESIKTDTEAKIEQSQKIIDLAESTPDKKIICGDFNLLPDTKSIKMLDEKYNNLIKKYEIKNTRSSLYKKENRFADYIFTSPKIKVNDFKVLEDEVSDHLPLFLDFD